MGFALMLMGLTNSIGTLAIWVMLQPYFANLTNNLALTGNLASIRQFSFLAGALIASKSADVGRPLAKLMKVQLIELLLGAFLLILSVIYNSTASAELIMVWSVFRFANSGFGFVYGFRVHSRATSTVGNGSIVHLLITQGASTIGPLLTLVLLKYSSAPIRDALTVDVISSVLYLSTLYKLKKSNYDPVLDGESDPRLLANIKKSALAFWDRHCFPWNVLQLVFLLAASGFLLNCQVLSRGQQLLEPSQYYSLTVLIYGLTLWALSAYHFYFRRSSEASEFYFAVITLIISGILQMSVNPYLSLISVFAYSIAFWLILNLTNRKILDSAPAAVAGRMRIALLFYMSIIFGLGETISGQLAAWNINQQITLGLRLIGSVFLIFIFSQTQNRMVRED